MGLKESVRSLQIFLLGLVLISTPINTSMPKYQNRSSPLQLETRILHAKYCKGPRDSNPTLHIQLALVYKNAGERPVILYKGANSIYREMVSLSLETVAAKNYIYDASLLVVTSGEPVIQEDESLPNKKFLIIPPGASYEATSGTDAVLILKNEKEENADITLTYGDYYLQVMVSIWPFSKELAESLKKRWNEMGDFYFYNVTSLPMPLKIEKEVKLAKCS